MLEIHDFGGEDREDREEGGNLGTAFFLRGYFISSLLALMIIWILFSNVLLINTSPSMPLGIYLKTFQSPRVGDIAIFPNPDKERVKANFLIKDVIEENDKGFIVRGRHPRSFDSRYFGTVEKDKTKKALPLWILD